MANTYTQLYFHVVFTVKYRQNLIRKDWEDELYKYITGIVSSQNQKMMIINGIPNHIHMLIGTKPNCNLSDLVRDIKANSSKWINSKKLVNTRFEWQSGFGAFTVGHSQVKRVVNYIKNQEKHHQRKSFKEEYIEFLKTNAVDYDEKYVFDRRQGN
ncbi:IS200/IS605 family transposase [Flavobacteriaceae bacterium 14752]|uniref:IS200/IS605 family transposase n=1 Tax=Mesohalobacter salilacus TaxID=2491711 RepID=UPI000F63CEDA|nr:IS200/IS605 family transposase [Flavobacteriaceae bacterium 14752]